MIKLNQHRGLLVQLREMVMLCLAELIIGTLA